MKIATKIVLLSLAVAAVMAVFSYAIQLNFYSHLLDANLEERVKHQEYMFKLIRERDTKILSSTADILSKDSQLMNVYLQNDREKLFEYAEPIFQNMRTNYGITHFYFISPNSTCFLRVHDKELFGDQITRATLREAKETGKISSGIELGKTAYALRAVTPYYKGTELIGYLELGEEIGHFLNVLKGHGNDEFAIMADKTHLSREDWKSAISLSGSRDSWDDIADHVVMTRTTDSPVFQRCLTEEHLEEIERGEIIRYSEHTKEGDFVCGGFPILDIEGMHLGAVMFLVDTSEQTGQLGHVRLWAIGITVTAFIIAFIVGYVLSLGITRPLSKLKHATKEIAKGKLDIKIEVNSNDETGDFASAFNSMATELKKSRTNILGKTGELEKTQLELQRKIKDMEKFSKVTTGRELRMIELKKKIKELEKNAKG